MSSIIIGELGELITVQPGNSFRKVFDKYLSDFHLSQSDCVIFDSKGQLVFKLSSQLSNENDGKYYIYTKLFEKETFSNYFDALIQKATSSYLMPININPNNLPDVHSNYALLEEKAKMLKMITPSEIKLTYERMLEFFENFKVIHKTLTINSKICEKIKECYQYQYCGIKCMIKYINNVTELCENAKEDVKNEYTNLLSIKESSLKLLQDGLDTLKKTELHPKMQNEKNKYLIDLYFDEEKMNEWIKSRVENTKYFSDAIPEKNKLFVNEYNKVLNEKGAVVSDIKNEWTILGSEYDKILKDLESKIGLIFNDISNEFLDFKKALNKIIEIASANILQSESTSNINNELEQSCALILKLKNKYSNFVILEGLTASLEPINDLCSKMRKSMERFPTKINSVFLNFISSSNTLVELSEKFNKYKARMIALEESFSSFKNPSYFPKAYEASIQEIKRRIIFNRIIQKDFELLNALIIAENTTRKEFIQNYGKYLPVEYFPSLRFSDLQLMVDYQNSNEVELYPNLLDEEDEKLILNHSLMPTLYGQSSPFDPKSIENLKKIINLQSEVEKANSLIQSMTDNFQSTLSIKDQLLKEKVIECENLTKKLMKKTGSNCPMCLESSLNSADFQTWLEYSKTMELKIQSKENNIHTLEKQISELLSSTNQIKNIFFNHMNSVIAEKNIELITYKTKVTALENLRINENEVQKYKKLYEEEKIKNTNYLTDLRLAQAKFDNSVLDYKKLESKCEEVKIKLNITNEKMLQLLQETQKYKNENDALAKLNDDFNLKLSQLENLLKISQNDNNELKEKNENLTKELKNCTSISNKCDSPDIIKIKNVEKGSRCIFVPHSEGIYTCINLSNPIQTNEQNEEKYFKCNLILNLNAFDDLRKELIIENSLIVIGTIGEMTEYNSSSNNYNLPEDSSYTIVTLKQVDYVIGFPGEELLFRNYNIISDDDDE